MVPRIEPAGTPTREDAVDRATCLPSPLAADDTLGKAGGMIKAHAVPVPSDSVLAPLYLGADLLDGFAIHLPAGASDDLEVLARVLFERQAGGGRGSDTFRSCRRVRGSWWWARTTGISTSESRTCCARARRVDGS